MNDPGAVILRECSLGRFVSPERYPVPRRPRPIIQDSTRYLYTAWWATERRYRRRMGIGCEDLVERIMQAREVEQ